MSLQTNNFTYQSTYLLTYLYIYIYIYIYVRDNNGGDPGSSRTCSAHPHIIILILPVGGGCGRFVVDEDEEDESLFLFSFGVDDVLSPSPSPPAFDAVVGVALFDDLVVLFCGDRSLLPNPSPSPFLLPPLVLLVVHVLDIVGLGASIPCIYRIALPSISVPPKHALCGHRSAAR